jgi:hypothetical protein
MGRSKLKDKHIRLARSVRFEHTEQFFKGKSAEELVDLAMEQFKERRYRIVERPRGKEWTTTMMFSLYLGHDFINKDPADRAAILWHEYVHASQWRALSLTFGANYLNAKWRWAYEVQGYRQQYRVYRALGMSDARVSKLIATLPGRFQGDLYKMGRLERVQLTKETIAAMEAGLEDFKYKAA